MAWTGRQPPPSIGVDESYSGKNLLRLVRSAEKEETKNVAELHALLRDFQAMFSRRGLLQYDAELADKILASGVKSNPTGRHDKKGKNKKSDSTPLEESKGESGVADDVNLILVALVRLVGGNHEISMPRTDFSTSLTRDGLAVCIAILQHAIANHGQDRCSMSEHELIVGVARGLLTGISRTLSSLLRKEVGDAEASVVDSGFQLAALTMSMFGTKLSRNKSVLASLKSLAWTSMSVANKSFHFSASRLLATFPLTGADSKTPSVLWTEAITDSVAALCLVLTSVAPTKFGGTAKKSLELGSNLASNDVNIVVSSWIGQIKNLKDVESRASQLTLLVSSNTAAVMAFCHAEGLVGRESTAMSAALLPISAILEVLSVMVSFPSLAESIYFGKKRLRHEVVEDGFLTPHSIAHQVANEIKMEGLELLRATLTCIGRSSLLPFGKRIAKITESALSASCSSTLLQALDANNVIGSDGKRQNWLQTSVEARTLSIMAFDNMISTLGSNLVASKSTSMRNGKRGHANKGISLVVGCLVEQIVGSTGDAGSWGSTSERSLLMIAAMDCLKNVLLSCGGFLPFSSRSLIDSAIKTCLGWHALQTTDNSVKVAFLRLLHACLTTPWSDGGTTSLVHEFRVKSKVLASDLSGSVVVEAHSCLSQIQFLSCQRAPPLLQVTRSVGPAAGDRLDAMSIIENLETVKQSAGSKKKAQASKAEDSKRKRERTAKRETAKADKKLKQEPKASEVDSKAATNESKQREVSHVTPNVDKATRRQSEPSQGVVPDDILPDNQQTTKDIVKNESDEGENLGSDDMDFMPGIVDTGPDADEAE